MACWEVGEGTVESDGRHEELGRVGGRVPAHDEDAWNGCRGGTTTWVIITLWTDTRVPLSEVNISGGTGVR